VNCVHNLVSALEAGSFSVLRISFFWGGKGAVLGLEFRASCFRESGALPFESLCQSRPRKTSFRGEMFGSNDIQSQMLLRKG
jgi:hypothetical protein